MRRFAVVLAAIGIFGGAAWATPITYTEIFTDSGSLGASSFTSALVTLTFIGDTTNVVNPLSGIFQNPIGTGTVNVSGVGSATFTDQMEAVVNQSLSGGAGGISDRTADKLTLFTINAAFSSYDLKSSFGPVSGTPDSTSR